MMSKKPLRTARNDELDSLWPTLKGAQLFDDPMSLRGFWREAPWKVMVAGRREGAVVDRWRAVSDILAIRGMWCPDRRIPEFLRKLASVARSHGFSRLLSPLVPEGGIEPYTEAGLRPLEYLLTLRLDDLSAERPAPPPPSYGVSVRTGSVADAREVLLVDSECFDDFWRYDPDTLSRYLVSERLGIAEAAGAVVGYTLCTSREDEGSIGRLAVAPEWRDRGVGAILLEDALGCLRRAGARRVMLCTQESNAASRRLYLKAGFRELAGRLVFLMSDSLG